MKYFIKRKIWQIKRVLKWLPLIWNTYDFDYSYSTNVFKFQLERQAEYLESEDANTLSAKTNARKIRTALTLMDKVYEDCYEMQWVEKTEEKYGENALYLHHPFSDGHEFDIKYEYEYWENAEQVKQDLSKWREESKVKQERAHKLLWEFIAHNIRYWWD